MIKRKSFPEIVTKVIISWLLVRIKCHRIPVPNLISRSSDLSSEIEKLSHNLSFYDAFHKAPLNRLTV